MGRKLISHGSHNSHKGRDHHADVKPIQKTLTAKQRDALDNYLHPHGHGRVALMAEDSDESTDSEDEDANGMAHSHSTISDHSGKISDEQTGLMNYFRPLSSERRLEQLHKKLPHEVMPKVHDHHGHHHKHHGKQGPLARFIFGHGSHEPSIITAIGAGLVNYTLMFGFSCAYGIIIFKDPGHAKHRTLGIRMALGTAIVMGFLLALGSNIPIAIGGPDMNAVIFIGNFVDRISDELLKQHNLDFNPTGESVGYQAGPTSDFCTGHHLDSNKASCDDYHEQLRATTIFAVMVSSVAAALMFTIIGGLKLTRYVAYVPTSIVDAFLSCMGYKVFKHGLKLCKHDPDIFIPAAAIGVPLYFIKALHLANPLIVLPVFLLVPLVVFYTAIFAQGWDLDKARKEKLMFYEVKYENFWKVWSDGAFKPEAINMKAWWSAKFDLVVMLIVLLLDCLVTALRTTENKIPLNEKIKKNYEMQLYGVGSLLSGFLGSPPGYMQLKLNVINYGVLGNVEDRRGGLLFALLCVAGFCGPSQALNYLPRHFIGMLLFFGGSGFVAEHLWGSREYLTPNEWGQVVIIVAVFVFTDELLYAVAAGLVMVTITFIVKYASVPCVVGRALTGGELVSREQHPPAIAISLNHIADNWLLVLRMKGYLFFASVQAVTENVKNVIELQQQRGEYWRTKYVLLECELLDGLDSSAEKDLHQLTDDIRPFGVSVLWSGLKPAMSKGLIRRRTIASESHLFQDIDNALLFVESKSLQYRRQQQIFWNRLHPTFDLHQNLCRLRSSFEPFNDVLRLDVERFGCPFNFCDSQKLYAFETILWRPGELGRELYLIHTGAVGLFAELPDKEGYKEPEKPVAVYRHGWFLNREFIQQSATRHFAIALEDGEVLQWNTHQWWRMHREQPFMASAITEAAMRQAIADMERMGKALRAINLNQTADEAAVEQMAHYRDQRGSILEQEQEAENLQAAIIAADYGLGLPSPGSKKETHQELPEFLQFRLEFLEAAQALERYGLYTAVPQDEVGVLPELPKAVRNDLTVAFNTYCNSHTKTVAWEKVIEALMYAGIFNVLLESRLEGRALTLEEFIELGHEAFLMRLSKRQVLEVWKVFSKWRDEDGNVDRDDLIDIFRESFMPRISEQEVNGISTVFDAENTGNIKCPEFLAIVSRFVRRHEQDWSLIRGIREILQKAPRSPCSPWDVLTVSNVVLAAKDAGTQSITKENAEEMLWVAACFSKLIPYDQHGQKLDFAGIAAAVLLSADLPTGRLPPPPRMAMDRRGTLCRPLARGSADYRKKSMARGSTWQAAPNLLTTPVPASPSVAASDDPSKNGLTDRLDKKQKWKGKDMPKTKPAEGGAVGKGHKKKPQALVFAAPKADLPGVEILAKPRRPKFDAKAMWHIAWAKLLQQKIDEAVSNVGVAAVDAKSRKLITDLRNMGCRDANSSMFLAPDLSKPDFDDRKITFCSIASMINKGTAVPDTPDAKIHLMLEVPESSPEATIWSRAMGVMIALSVTGMLVRTLITASNDGKFESESARKVWLVFECFLTIAFLGELVVRFAVADAIGTQTRVDFITKPMNLCDLIASLPFFIELIGEEDQGGSVQTLQLARLLRLARVARIARLVSASRIFGPISAVFTIIWAIYLKEKTL